MKPIDLFSDTTTKPTPAMLMAMINASVGDEQRDQDPTVLELQDRVAQLLGHEAALFLPSTTMANQIAIKLHTDPGDEVILEARSHPANAEAGGPGLISGVMLKTIHGERGLITPEQIQSALRPDLPLFSRSRLVWIENTHNMGGGAVWPLDQLQAVCELARSRSLRLHLDGARLLHAATALDVAPHKLTQGFDTVSFCLSKGLGCPVGGLLAGSKELIAKARRLKQALGGAMRQAGYLAAAGLYALDHHIERLKVDHDHAAMLAEGLATIPGISIDPSTVETNIVIFDVTDPRFTRESFVARLAQHGVILSLVSGQGVGIRAVTHLDVSSKDIDQALSQMRSVLT